MYIIHARCMVLRQIFCRFTGSAAQTHCARRPQLVSKKFLKEEIFAGTNFRELAFDRENRENFYLAKISHYTVLLPEVSLLIRITSQWTVSGIYFFWTHFRLCLWITTYLRTRRTTPPSTWNFEKGVLNMIE